MKLRFVRCLSIAGVIAFGTFTVAQSVDKDLRALFDDTVQPLASAHELPSWSQTLQRIDEQKTTLNQCVKDENKCERRLKSVHHLLDRGNELSREKRVRLVNRYVNRFSRYREDRRREVQVGESTVRIGQEWSTLTEFLRRGGDCEDYATAKYQLLRMLGIPAEELRVIVIYDRREREHHAIIGVANVDGRTLLLDTDDQTFRRGPMFYQFVYALKRRQHMGLWRGEHSIEVVSTTRVTRESGSEPGKRSLVAGSQVGI